MQLVCHRYLAGIRGFIKAPVRKSGQSLCQTGQKCNITNFSLLTQYFFVYTIYKSMRKLLQMFSQNNSILTPAGTCGYCRRRLVIFLLCVSILVSFHIYLWPLCRRKLSFAKTASRRAIILNFHLMKLTSAQFMMWVTAGPCFCNLCDCNLVPLQKKKTRLKINKDLINRTKDCLAD